MNLWDGAKSRHGLTLSTESFSINDTVRLLNVLMIRYRLDGNIRKHSTSYTIYIKEKSMPLLRTLVQPYMHSSMLYKLKINLDDTTQVSSPPLPCRSRVNEVCVSEVNHTLSSGFTEAVNKAGAMKEGRNRIEVRLNFQIEVEAENKDLVLLPIKDFFGGSLSYNKSKNKYTYSSNTFGSARKIIRYFDKFHLQSRKYISYLK